MCIFDICLIIEYELQMPRKSSETTTAGKAHLLHLYSGCSSYYQEYVEDALTGNFLNTLYEGMTRYFDQIPS
jgi:hypothetical protein